MANQTKGSLDRLFVGHAHLQNVNKCVETTKVGKVLHPIKNVTVVNVPLEQHFSLCLLWVPIYLADFARTQVVDICLVVNDLAK